MKKAGMIMIACFGITAIAAIDYWQLRAWQKSRKTELSSLADLYQNRLESSFARRFNIVETIKAHFAIHPETEQDEFNHLSKILIQNNSPIRSLQFADSQAFVKYVFPVESNEIAVRDPMHLLSDHQRGPFVKKAIETRQMTLQGPYELRQKGMGVAVRSPIFNGDRFLGLAIGIYDISVLLNEVCERVAHDKVILKLSDAQGNIFAGQKDDKIESAWETRGVTAADTVWTLALAWRQDSLIPAWRHARIWIPGVGIWLLMFLFFYNVSEQNRRLTQTVAQRTRELAEKNRSLSREIAEQKQLQQKLHEQETTIRHIQKLDSLGTLAGGVAHEYNNILGIILGNSELALDEIPEWSPARIYLEEIRQASLRGKEVGRQILIYINKMPTHKTPLNIGSVIADSLQMARASIPRNIAIEESMVCDHEMILANASDIKQLFMNLCSNSVHAIGDACGGISVALKTVRIDQTSAAAYEDLRPGDYVKLNITDTGSGIDPAIIERVFEPYFTTKEVNQGMGMGLAVVHGIVKNYHGAVKLESRPGKGTTVEVLFPQLKTEAAAEEDAPATSPEGSERILMVEDEEALLRMTARMLNNLNYQVTAQSNSVKALKMVQENPHGFDLVITDMGMPDLDGERLAQEIIKIRADLPIIIVTGYSDRMDEQRAKKIGLAGYAAKPLTRAHLAQIVRQALNHNGSP